MGNSITYDGTTESTMLVVSWAAGQVTGHMVQDGTNHVFDLVPYFKGKALSAGTVLGKEEDGTVFVLDTV